MVVASFRCSLRTLLVLTIAALVVLARPHSASAQNVEAESLFQAGKQLLKDGKIPEACDKFEASDRLEASVGTELNAADCREKNNQLATAWAIFLKAASNAMKAGNDAKREAEARRRASLLEPRLSYLTINVPDQSKVDGLVISRNGETIDSALWNQGVPVDDGTYTITGQAPGHEQWSTTVTVAGEGDKQSVEVPRFKQIADLVKPKDDGDKGKGKVVGDNTTPPKDDHVDRGGQPGMFSTPLRKVAIGAAGVGVIGVVGAVVFGLKANDLKSQSDALCPDTQCGNQHAIDLNNQAKSAALTSNIMIGVAVIGIGGAAAAWFLGAPHHTTASTEGDDALRITPVIGGGQTGFALTGSF